MAAFPYPGAMTKLLEDVEAFLSTHPELSASRFGVMAVNDGHLVRRMQGKHGKRPQRSWPEREEKVRQFMLRYRP